jgi:hypothetical protein
MEEPKAKISNEIGELDNSIEGKGSPLTLLLSKLVEKFTGKDMAVGYQFDNLEIDMMNATMLGGKKIGSIKWRIDGKFVVSSELLQ